MRFYKSIRPLYEAGEVYARNSATMDVGNARSVCVCVIRQLNSRGGYALIIHDAIGIYFFYSVNCFGFILVLFSLPQYN